MNVAYLIGGLIIAAIMFDGVWMLVSARPLIVLLHRGRSKTPAAQRWMGAAQVVGGAGVITLFSLAVANASTTVGVDIAMSLVGGMFLCYAASWWVDHRARRQLSN
jgi:hypothetical protein